MPPAGSDDRDKRTRQSEPDTPISRPVDPATSMFTPPSEGGESRAGEPPTDTSGSGDNGNPRSARPQDAPPGTRAEPASEPESRTEREPPITAPPQWPGAPATPPPRSSTANLFGPDDYPPGYGTHGPPAAPPQRYDRFGWPILDGTEAEGSAAPPIPPLHAPVRPENISPGTAPQPYNPYDTSSFQTPPMPNAPPLPRGPYSGQIPTPPQQSGQFAVTPRDPQQSGPLPPVQEHPLRSGAFPIPLDVQRSGQFPTTPDAVYRSDAYAPPPAGAPSGYYPDAGSYPSGTSPSVGAVTSTGSRRVIVAPDAGLGSLLTDRPALAFLLAAVVLAGLMIAYIAIRYAHFPDQIALHFGPAGASQPNRIGEKRELWTIPFIVGIVLTANTALAWALYRYDRFAARLLTLGAALVAAIAWVVLLTLLHR